MIRYFLIFFTFLILGSLQVFSQELIRSNYGTVAAKIDGGNSSMQVSSAAYSTQNLQSGIYRSQQGFLSVLANSNFADSLALVDLYIATNPGDTTWFNSTGWLTAPLNEWHGVGLNAEGKVTYLDLNNNNLTGTLPESLKSLDSLEFFFFYVNPNLEGNLFDFLVNYPNLQRVSAHDCSFSGTILPEVFHPGLLEIRVFNNQLTGEIPVEISNSPLLDQFNAGGNQLEGAIPSEVGTLTSLFDFSINQNLLNGEIPNEIGNMTNLRFLNLSDNGFNGNIPPSLGQLTNLEELNLSGNMLSGNLPVELGQLINLRNLYLNNNQISGEVPATYENLVALEAFFMYQNQLEGTLPDILHLPVLRDFDVYGNGRLFVEIPGDLSTLTNLSTFAIGGTVANRGEFPEAFYQLTNLVRLDLGGQRFTGSLTSAVANWSNLDNIYLWQNELTGELPQEFAAIPTLRAIGIAQNDFTAIPDFSSAGVTQLDVVGNRLSFNSLIPNLAVSEFNFRNQKRIDDDTDVQLNFGENYELSSSMQDQEGTNYAWIFNNDTIASGATSLSVTNFDFSKSGSYRLIATHPAIDNFISSSGFTNLQPTGAPRAWYVDNRPNASRDFASLYQAVYASRANDTLYVAGSSIPYDTPGGLLLNSPRVIIGPGYFLEENTETQFNKQAAVVADGLTINKGADGTQIFGLSFSNPVRLNSTFFTAGDTLNNVSFIGNRFLPGSNFGFVSHIDGLTFKGNYGALFAFYITDVAGSGSGLYANYKNFDVSNNINLTVRPFAFQFFTSAENNGMENINFSFNVIDSIANINDAVFENNIIKPHTSTGSTFINNIDFNENLFTNASDSLKTDRDFITIDPNLPQGAFAGDKPYLLSGLPPVPAIYNIEIGQRLSAKVNAKTTTGENISRLRYQYRQNNQSSSAFNVRGFNPTPDLEVEFLPNRSVIQANETYDLVFVAIDENGKRSHRTYIPYEAIAANLSGAVVDIDAVNVNEGNVRLFAINPFANKYDTTAVQALNGSNTFNFENLILGDYIILADPDEGEYPNLIPTYLGNTLDWQVADTLFLEQNVSGVTIAVEKQPEPLTEPGSEIFGFIEEELVDADSSLRAINRRRVSSAGVSVRSLANTTRNVSESLRLFNSNTELVAYVKTNESGEFSLPNLPAGEYSIRFEYPGVTMDETSDVILNISGDRNDKIEVQALVEDGKISVSQVIINSEKPAVSKSFSFYPNPAQNILNLKLENAAEAQSLSIIDLNGRQFAKLKIENGNQQIDINHLPNGIYLLRLEDNNGNYLMAKLIKR